MKKLFTSLIITISIFILTTPSQAQTLEVFKYQITSNITYEYPQLVIGNPAFEEKQVKDIDLHQFNFSGGTLNQSSFVDISLEPGLNVVDTFSSQALPTGEISWLNTKSHKSLEYLFHSISESDIQSDSTGKLKEMRVKGLGQNWNPFAPRASSSRTGFTLIKSNFKYNEKGQITSYKILADGGIHDGNFNIHDIIYDTDNRVYSIKVEAIRDDDFFQYHENNISYISYDENGEASAMVTHSVFDTGLAEILTPEGGSINFLTPKNPDGTYTFSWEPDRDPNTTYHLKVVNATTTQFDQSIGSQTSVDVNIGGFLGAPIVATLTVTNSTTTYTIVQSWSTSGGRP